MEQTENKQPQAEQTEPVEQAPVDHKKKKEPKDKAALEAAKKELAEQKEAYLRLAAEYDNFRKRSAKEKDEIYPNAKAEVVAKFLPVFDNLERALQVEVSEESAKAIKTGVEMVEKQLREVLEKLGVEEIEALGKEFDPNLHNAVMQEEAEEGQESGIVKEVLMKGYKTKDRVLRHSMVKVTN